MKDSTINNADQESKDENAGKVFAKKALKATQNGLQKFSNHIWVKSLVSGFVSAMPIIIVSSLFMLMTAIPEIFGITVNEDFENFTSRIYQFTFGIMGMVVTGQIAKALTGELNQRLTFDRKIGQTTVMVSAMCAYFLMSVVQFDREVGESSFASIQIGELGATGVLPGMVIGIVTPYIFFVCNKYNITIRLPKAVPQVISQSFLAIVPWFFTILLWGGIGYLFIYFLGQPFIPWFFELLSASLFNESVASSYGMIVSYRFLETFSWFIGVHPEAIQGVFENIMNVNMASNATGATNYAFVESLMGPAGNMGGTGSTFVLPILLLLFAKSDELKVAGKTSVVPVSFQVNEPILFGAPVILNPVFVVPFMVGPMVTSSLAKLFVDSFGLVAAKINVPWATPWFIRGPIAQLGQWQVFVLLGICFLILFMFWLPFVLLQDRINLKNEAVNPLNKEVKINGIQFLMQSVFSFDFEARKEFIKFKKKNHHEVHLAIINNPEIKTELLSEYKNNLAAAKISTDQIRVQNVINYNNAKCEDRLDKIEIQFKDKLSNINFDQKLELYNNYQNGNKVNDKGKKIVEPKLPKEVYGKYYSKKLQAELKRDLAIQRVENSNKNKPYDFVDLKAFKASRLVENQEKVLLLIQTNQQKISQGINPYQEEVLVNKEVAKQTHEFIDRGHKVQKVLVLCIGAGTSAMLANAINGGANKVGDKLIEAQALAYTNYQEALKDVDMIITSPQLQAYLESIEADAKNYNIQVYPTRGKQYIDLCNNKKEAYEFVKEKLTQKLAGEKNNEKN